MIRGFNNFTNLTKHIKPKMSKRVFFQCTSFQSYISRGQSVIEVRLSGLWPVCAKDCSDMPGAVLQAQAPFLFSSETLLCSTFHRSSTAAVNCLLSLMFWSTSLVLIDGFLIYRLIKRCRKGENGREVVELFEQRQLDYSRVKGKVMFLDLGLMYFVKSPFKCL